MTQPPPGERRTVVYSDQAMNLFKDLCKKGRSHDVIKIRDRCTRIARNPETEGSSYLAGDPPVFRTFIKGHELETMTYPAGFRILYAFDDTVLYVAKVAQVQDIRFDFE